MVSRRGHVFHQPRLEQAALLMLFDGDHPQVAFDELNTQPLLCLSRAIGHREGNTGRATDDDFGIGQGVNIGRAAILLIEAQDIAWLILEAVIQVVAGYGWPPIVHAHDNLKPLLAEALRKAPCAAEEVDYPKSFH